MIKFIIVGILLTSIRYCDQKPLKEGPILIDKSQSQEESYINPNGHTIETRFIQPNGFERIEISDTSFGAYLRKLPLKPDGSVVKYFNGRTKANNGIYAAVIDLEIGKKDLHQCADAIMRLYAAHLYQKQEYEKIQFNFTNGFPVGYSEWMKGKRIKVEGNNVRWVETGQPSNSYADFWKYLETIFTYAGTISLEKELVSTKLTELKIGDVFIMSGSPGHAILVVDIVINKSTGEKKFLLAQSYMPAQEIQVLLNPEINGSGPWYSTEFGGLLRTPEWTFNKGHLKRFK